MGHHPARVPAARGRSPQRRTAPRLVELALLWLVVGGGFWVLFAGLFHVGPTAPQVAQEIGYAPSMFQWEVGWGDIAMGVLGLACARRRFRDGWLSAAVVMVFISFWGDGIGHVWQMTQHNHAPDNVWVLPTNFLQPVIAAVLLAVYRRHHPRTGPDTVARRPGAPAWR